MQRRQDASDEFFVSGFAASREASGTKRGLWWIAFQQRSVWSRGAKLGLSVGVLQAIINQGGCVACA